MRKRFLFVSALLFCLSVSGNTTESARAAQNVCDHPFYPVREGLKHTFRTTYGSKNASYLSEIVVHVLGQNHFSNQTSSPDYRKTIYLTCEGGGIVSRRSGLTTQMFENGKMVTNTSISSSGWNILAPAKKLHVGGTWKFDQIFEYTVEGKTYRARGGSVSRVVSVERLRVPAGTFRALKITTTFETTSLSATPPNDKTSRGTQTDWYVRDIGLVKSQIPNVNTMELVAVQ